MTTQRKPRTPAEVAAASPADRAEWARATAAHLRAVADACHTAGLAHHGLGTAARSISGVEAAWRTETACCARGAVGRSCGCAGALP